MSGANACPRCGARVDRDATWGLCPKCLLGAQMPPTGEGSRDPAVRGGESPVRGFQPPTPAELASLFPQLEIVELIGQGGMGAVYRARQKSLDRPVALKIIRPESADDPGFAERFQREARSLARLNHQHIVAVHDFGEVHFPRQGSERNVVEGKVAEPQPTTATRPSTLFYFIMEYVDGVDLRQLMIGQTLSAGEALAIIPQICDALQYAHDEGIVHRDIKPENILLDARGRVKIADFGLAKLLDKTAIDFSLTGTHQVMGTPRYMAPEQMESSRGVDHRADIYSLGVVFYEMLTGQIPAGHFDPPSKKVQVDARLDQVVLRSLAREPERRYQRASELKSDVERVSSGGDFVREPSSQPDSHTATTMRDVAPAGTGKTPVPLGTLVVRFLTLVCAGPAVASVFLKWTRVSVAPVVQGTNAIPEASAFDARGMHYLYPVLAAIMALALCFVTVSVFDRVRSRLLAIGALATGLAFCLVALTVAVGEPFPSHAGWSDAGSHLYPQQSYRWTDAASQLIGRWQYWGDVSIHVEPQEGPLVAGLCGCALVFLGFVELRWCVDENARRSADDPLAMARFVGEPLTLAALAAFAAPVVAVVTWGAYLFATGGDFPGEMGLPTLIIAAIPIHLAHVATCGWVMWMGGRAMRRGSGYGWAIAGSIAAMLPLSFAWVVSLPVGIWALIVLLRADVRQAFRQQAAAELFNAAENSNLITAEVLAARLRTCGTLLLVGSAIAVVSQVWVPISILAERARRPEDNIPYVVIFMMLGATGIPVVFSAIMAFGGWKLRKLTSFAWGRVAAVLAIVPFSLAAPLLIPVGVWTLVQLHRRVRFPDRTRDDERVGRASSLFLSAKKGEAEHPGSPVGQAAGEVASESDTAKADRGKMQADESLGFVVFGFVVVGGSRCLELFPRVWKIADQLFVDGPQSVESPARLLLQLTGPFILWAAIAVYHRRWHRLALAGSLLCMASGNFLSVVFAIWSLFALLDPKARVLFHDGDLSSERGTKAKKPAAEAVPMSSSSGFESSAHRPAWQNWIGQNAMLLQAVLWVLFFVAMYFTFSLKVQPFGELPEGTNASEAREGFAVTVGEPSPWLRYEKTTKPNLAIRNYVSFSSSSFVIAVLGVLASWLARRVDQFRPFPGEGFVGSVRFLIVGWVIVVATAVLPGLASLRMSVTLDSPMRAVESVESSADEPESSGLLPAAK